MARGDVLLIDFPAPAAGSLGKEQVGRRPAIAVEANLPGINLPTLMVVPLTSQLAASRFPFTFEIQPSDANGLTQPSVCLVFQLRAIDRQRIQRTLEKLEQEYLEQLDLEMRRMLGLEGR